MNTRVATVAVCLSAAVLIAGCSAPTVPPTPSPPTSAPAPPPPGSSGKVGALPAAGITDLGDGRVVAHGWVVWVDLEGGFWAIDNLPPTSSANHATLAVLLPGKITADRLKSVEGTYVGAEGVRQEGASIRMAGPELVVDALRVY